MKKYLLLAIPIIYWRNSILYFESEAIVNLIVVLTCLFYLLRITVIKNLTDWILSVLFFGYFCILFNRTVFFRGFTLLGDHDLTIEYIYNVFYTTNFIPLKSILVQLQASLLYQIIGNTIMLAPFSFSMLYFKWTKNYKKTFWYSLLITIGIEFIQFVENVIYRLFQIGMNRSTDIDDIILNTFGACIGMVCYYLWNKIEHTYIRKDSWMNV